MNIAENKKRNNISEYIIHMYQTEDLIRVYNFNMDDVRQYVISHIPVEKEEKEELAKWYEMVMENMKEEGIEERGHLSYVQAYVQELSALSAALKTSDEEFKKIYNTAKPHIEESLKFAQGAVKGEVQVCLNGVYGLLLARMNGRDVPQELMEGINAFGSVLSYLSYKYKEARK
ncbi:hypothetical protein C900_04964 [Fulvivirga imtechensis AK7]|uniref:DUF4924 domain-containing protein n=1 Tax=Fulvivirga imtechensis AK7 TaxID=1237149 RepID=L8JPX4_9BACT|nr:DUF4924 family protein [Fulvivirga imtechensis]ELR69432.1 hypothetical protein C900_04964 [Fulvivirga imtechensis AK7]